MRKRVKKGLLYFHTLKYLKFQQIYFRLFYLFYQPSVKLSIKKNNIKKTVTQPIQWFIVRNKIHLKKNTARFLNHDVDISAKNIWNDPSQSALWLYNLHYFDGLNANDLEERSISYALLNRWIDENPPFFGIGWQPYPISLRIVNIIKYALSGNTLSDQVMHSLYLQSRYLNKKCEYHLLGNHLFENFKALCMAGLFFDTQESDKWFKKSLWGLKKEIQTQVLADGGHFELSLMYHSIVLEGLLDLQNIFSLYKKEFVWKEIIEKMLFWLHAMKRSNREISYFNDAANDIAATPELLFEYAKKLGYCLPEDPHGLTHLSSSGFFVVTNNQVKLIGDVGDVGPDYLPGHAHADTLSFELMVDDAPLFVNLGTSCYGNSERRLFERGTSAHNTVVIDQKNSSEVWGGFRVAKRARVKKILISENQDTFTIQAAHNGYARFKKGLLHHRTWKILENNIEITDQFNRPIDHAVAYFHLHPSTNIVAIKPNSVTLSLKNGVIVLFESGNELTIIENRYAHSFGDLQNSQSIKVTLNKNNHAHYTIGAAPA